MKNTVVVLGGGPAAAVTAILLKDMNYDVLLIGKIRNTCYLEGASPRVVEGFVRAKCYHAARLLATFWQRGADWGGKYREVNGEHVVDRQALDQALRSDLIAAGVNVVDARVSEVYEEQEIWKGKAEKENGETFHFESNFLVEARGRGVSKRGPDVCVGPLSVALLRHVKGQVGHPFRTLTEAFEQGWAWATFRPDGAGTIQFVIDHSDITVPLENLHEGLCKQLTLIPGQLGHFSPLGRVISRGIQPVLRSEIIGLNYLRVGDAAYSCDPLSGHGMYEAISGSFAAAPTINTLLRKKEDRDLALKFYKNRAESLFYQRLDMAYEFYDMEKRWDHPFWKARRKPTNFMNTEIIDSSDASIIKAPVIENGFIVERSILLTSEYPGGVRFIAGVEVARLLDFILVSPHKYTVSSLARELAVTPDQLNIAMAWINNKIKTIVGS